MTLPSSYIYPSTYEPDRQSQWQTGFDGYLYELNSCLANCATLALEIMHYKKTGQIKHFSLQWVYGNRRYSSYTNEGLNGVDTLNMLVNDGCPFYYTLPQNFFYTRQAYLDTSPVDTSPLSTSKEAVDAVYNTLITEARKNKITSWVDIKSYGTYYIKQAIIDTGCLIINIPNGDDLWDAENGGVIAGSSGAGSLSHTMVIRGWKTIGTTEYWICQNSWCDTSGNPLGDNGLYYLPISYATIYNIWKLNYNTTIYSYPSAFDFRDITAQEGEVSIYAEDWNKLLKLLNEEVYRKRHYFYYWDITSYYITVGAYISASGFNHFLYMLDNYLNMNTGIGYKSSENWIYAADYLTIESKANILM